MRPYYERDGITIYHGDCREVLPTLERADAVITDPPYGDATHEGARTGAVGTETLVNFASIDAETLRSVYATANPRRWTVATMEWRHIATMSERPPDGMRFVRFGVWVKPNGCPQFTGDRPAQGWEGICILHAAEQPLRWNGGGRHGVWTVNKVNSEHPTGKPLTLVAQFVDLFTEPGEVVLDPFMGAGTTLEACKLAGRRAVGIEKDERYCEIAAKRLAQGVLFGTSV